MSDYPFTPGDILELSSLYGCLHYAIHVSGQSLGDDRYEARIIHVAGPDSEEMPSPRVVVKEDGIQFSATAPPYIITGPVSGKVFGRERGVIKEETIQFTARSPSYTITNYFDNNLTADAAEEIINKARSMVSHSISSEPRRLLSQMQHNSLYYRLWNQDFNYEKYNNQFATWCRYGVHQTFNYRVLEYPFTPGDILELSSLYGCLHYAIHVSGRALGDDRYEARIIHVAGPDSEEMPSPERAVVKEDVIQFSATAPPYIISNYFDDHWPVRNDILKKAYSKLGKWEFNREKKNDEHFANWCRYGQPVSSTTAASMGISEGVKYASYSAGELGRSARYRFVSGRIGVSKGDEKGIVLETGIAEVEVGSFSMKLGVGMTTGVTWGNGTFGIQILGFGGTVGKEKSLSVAGSKVTYKGRENRRNE